MGSKKLSFAISGSVMIIAFFAIINYLTSFDTLWFIYPSFAVLWWPVSVYCAQKKKYLLLAIVGSAMTAIFLAVVNYLTSPSYPWSIYPIFALLWWPLGVYSAQKKKLVLFSIIGCIITIAFLIITNVINTPHYPWSLNLLFAILWWPLSVFCANRKRYRLLAVLGSVLILGTLIFNNYYPEYSGHPWFLYAIVPILWWPITMFVGKKAGSVGFAILSSIIISGCYLALNHFLSPGYPWFIYPAFAVLWWPLGVYFGRKGRGVALSIAGTILTAAFFVIVNLISSPNVIWAVYPIFAILWWPLSVYYFNDRSKKQPQRKKLI